MSKHYGPDRAQVVDVWRAASAASAPVLVFWHGGAWVSGHPGWVRFMAPAAASHGFALVAPGYRLAPRCRWPAQLDDAAAVLAWVRAHAAGFGGDAERIVLAGHSAGGHLAAHAALRMGGVRGCLPVSAPLDLRYGDVPLESDAGRVYRYLLAKREDDADASPIRFVARNAPPFHLTWGGADFDRVADSGARFAAALAGAGGRVSHDVLQGATHFDTHLALADPATAWWAEALSVLELSPRP